MLALLFVLLLCTGASLFAFVAGKSVEESFYRTFGAFTTTDLYGEPRSGRVRGISAALTITGGLFYLLLVGSVVRTLVLRTVAETLRERRVRKQLSELNEHYVVCGYGNIGRAVTQALFGQAKDVVVIDRKPENVSAAEIGGAVAIVGHASDQAVLELARIRKAAGLVASVGSDAENIYIALAARRCNPEIFVVGRASTRDAETNMSAAKGVFNRVSTPYTGAGQTLARDVIERREG